MNVKCHVCIGGTNARRDIRELAKGVHVVVGTPGRVLHLLKLGALKPVNIKILCIDEADEMLSDRGMFHLMNGRSQLPVQYYIDLPLVFEHVPPKDRQTILLSATIPEESWRDLTKAITMKNPVKILVKKEQLTLEGIQQFFIEMEREDWKLETLCDLYTNETFTHPTVVFRNSRKKVDQLHASLEERHLPASATVRTAIPHSDSISLFCRRF